MRGEQNRVRSMPVTSDLSSSPAAEDAPASRAFPVPGSGNRTDQVDALVDAFLAELGNLSGEFGVASASSFPNTPPPEIIDFREGESSDASEDTGTAQRSESEEGQVVHDLVSIATPGPSEGELPQAAGLTAGSETADVDFGPSQAETAVRQDASVPPCSPEAPVKADSTVYTPQGELIHPPHSGPLPLTDAAPALLFQEKRKDRPSFYRAAILALISLAVLAAGYFFLGSTRPNRLQPDRSNSQPAPAAAPARTDSPGDGDIPIWPARSDHLPVPAGEAIPVQPDAGVLQITQPVPIREVMPPYPKEARSLRIDGPVEVDVSADLDDTGKVLRATAVDGPEAFRSAAEEAMMKWSFKPAADKGVNIRSTVRVTIVFKP